MFTRSSESRRHTDASDPGLLPNRRESSVRIMSREYQIAAGGLRIAEARRKNAPEGQSPDGGGAPADDGPLRGCGAACYASTLMTTRRFWARPAFVLFGAIGFSLP